MLVAKELTSFVSDRLISLIKAVYLNDLKNALIEYSFKEKTFLVLEVRDDRTSY